MNTVGDAFVHVPFSVETSYRICLSFRVETAIGGYQGI